MSNKKHTAVEKALARALKNPEFMLAVNRGQKSIKIDLSKVSDPAKALRKDAKNAGFCTHVENDILYLYVD